MPRTLAVLLLAMVAGAVQNHDPQGYTYHEHSLTKPYDGVHDRAHWTYTGSTVVSDKYIRLTPDRQSRKGALWNLIPFNPSNVGQLDVENPPWELTIEFHVHGSGKKLFGDGFAVWYTKEQGYEGPVFGNQENFVGMGVFFDTYSNLQQGHQQYISVMLNDGTQPYDHSKDGGDAKLAGCPIDFRGREHAFARIIHQGSYLRAYVDTNDQGWQECFIIRNVHLPRGYYFGVTAATGDLADNHDIISIKTSEPLEMTPEERQSIEKRVAEDIRDHVAARKHVDPQYDPELQPESDNFPAYLLVIAICVIVGVVYLTAKEQRRAATHFT